MHDDARREISGRKAVEISSRKGRQRPRAKSHPERTGSAAELAAWSWTYGRQKNPTESQKANGSSTVSQAYPVQAGAGVIRDST